MAVSDTSAVKFFTYESPQVVKTLILKLEAAKLRESGNIARGLAQDWGDYRNRVGYIKGISEAIDICEELTKEN